MTKGGDVFPGKGKAVVEGTQVLVDTQRRFDVVWRGNTAVTLSY
jgi:hypothetical protein